MMSGGELFLVSRGLIPSATVFPYVVSPWGRVGSGCLVLLGVRQREIRSPALIHAWVHLTKSRQFKWHN